MKKDIRHDSKIICQIENRVMESFNELAQSYGDYGFSIGAVRSNFRFGSHFYINQETKFLKYITIKRRIEICDVDISPLAVDSWFMSMRDIDPQYEKMILTIFSITLNHIIKVEYPEFDYFVVYNGNRLVV